MRDLLDTSVLVAAHVGDHVNHDASLRALIRAAKATSCCAAHTLAEVYAVLTSLPLRPMIRPEQAMLFLANLRDRLTIVTLDESAYFETLEAAASLRVKGGQIYDALLLRCARQADAGTIITWNVKHFQRIAPDIADRITTP